MRRQAIAWIAALASSVSLAACSGSSGSDEPEGGGGGEGEELQTVRLAAVPVVDLAAIYIGMNEGYFEEQGLQIDITYGQGSAAMIPALLNDEYDIQFAGSVNLLQATDQGLPLQAIAPAGRSTGVQGEDHGGVLVPPDSDIQRPADLEGRTVAVNALGGLHEVCVWAAVAEDGGDPSTIDFVELPLQDMNSALGSGQVDAISTSEPFYGIGLDEGNRLVTSVFVDTVPDHMVTAVYMVTEEKAQADPEMIDAFVAGLEQSFAHAREHPDEVRAELSNFTEIEAGLTESMILTDFTWGLTREDLAVVADASAQAETIDDPEAATDRAAGYLDGQG
ncbi:ABC transporter substrate-binding protein [Georgenia alba]|uniref:ABC transporter substrate-binding protein n=1 Tax=Georgenia alba TaxID=2233858 RepID=A0ABW2QE35_9MICO